MSALYVQMVEAVRSHAEVLPLAMVLAVSLAAVLLSLLSWLRSRRYVAAFERRNRESSGKHEAAVSALRESVAALTAQLEEVRREVPAAQPGLRPALNLSKRSQALRMHRRGDGPEQIATTLEVPRPEVELLLKVHRLIVKNF